MVRDGQFLVRESTREQGQYILTGMAAGKKQHMLLIDKHGKVRYIKLILDQSPMGTTMHA